VAREAGAEGNSAAGDTIKVSLQRLRHRCDLIGDTLAQTARRAQTV